MLEARCKECGEIFNPMDEGDLEHLLKTDGENCGGTGVIVGEWNPDGEETERQMDDHAGVMVTVNKDAVLGVIEAAELWLENAKDMPRDAFDDDQEWYEVQAHMAEVSNQLARVTYEMNAKDGDLAWEDGGGQDNDSDIEGG